MARASLTPRPLNPVLPLPPPPPPPPPPPLLSPPPLPLLNSCRLAAAAAAAAAAPAENEKNAPIFANGATICGDPLYE